MPPLALVKGFLEQATAKGTRATVLKPIGWMMVILVSATLSSYGLSAPPWLGVLFAVFTALTMVLYLVAYVYCLFTDKDALRSETYSIQKLAIEKGFLGDDIVGPLKPRKPVIGVIDLPPIFRSSLRVSILGWTEEGGRYGSAAVYSGEHSSQVTGGGGRFI
jgi:hypothetical protein